MFTSVSIKYSHMCVCVHVRLFTRSLSHTYTVTSYIVMQIYKNSIIEYLHKSEIDIWIDYII